MAPRERAGNHGNAVARALLSDFHACLLHVAVEELTEAGDMRTRSRSWCRRGAIR
jgi:hypothetical protein